MVADTRQARDAGLKTKPYFGEAEAANAAISRSRWCMVPQDELEPLLRQRAGELGADVRFGHELVEVDQDHDEVRAIVLDRAADRRYLVRAAFLVCADGSGSGLRDRFGIAQTGPGTIAHFMNI